MHKRHMHAHVYFKENFFCVNESYCPWLLHIPAHSGRVTDLKFIEEQEWLISVSRDKTFQFYCTKTGRKLGSYEAQAWCMAVEYPFIKYC